MMKEFIYNHPVAIGFWFGILIIIVNFIIAICK